MKNGKRLQRWMKDLLKKKGLNPDNWLYIKNTPNELVIMHKYLEKTRTIPMEKGARKREKETDAETGKPQRLLSAAPDGLCGYYP